MTQNYLDFAAAPTIIRANQKDQYFERFVVLKKLTDFVHAIKGSTYVSTHLDQLESLSKLVYLALTTLAGSRTLGEEYVDLYYVTPSGKKIPRFLPRLGFVVALIGGPRLLNWIGRKLKAAHPKLPEIDFTDLVNLHLALFYFSGRYYQFSKRLFGMRYALGYRVNPNARQARGNYELLGLLILAQLAIKYGMRVSKWLGRRSAPGNAAVAAASDRIFGAVPFTADATIDLSDPALLPYIPKASRTCMLCLEEMTDPACATCGHIFCWNCIMDWCKQKQECPLCRAAIRPQQILTLK